MADEQIIKALEHNASKCKFYEDGHDGGLFESTLDLINRQKAEIERLTAKILVKDNINDYNTAQLRIAREKCRTIKSEAIKEFAERLKKEALIDSGYEVLQSGTIDNLVKKMTEVQE